MTISNEYITIDKEIAGGIPIFKNTRVAVKTLFDYLEDSSIADFLEGFPSVSRKQAEGVLYVLSQCAEYQNRKTMDCCWQR